jgi:RNA polymerase sigma-70 factor, ECF subfamily
MAMDEREKRWAADMRASQLGCAESYARLLTEIAVSIRQLAAGDLKRLGIDASDAEDIVQETLLAIHVKQATWDAGRPFIPWVRALTRHKTIDLARRRGRAAELPIDDFAETLACPHPAPDRTIPVDQVLQQLPRRQRQVVQALALDGASVRETASRLKISPGAVYTALHRGLAALALKLGGWGT